MVPFPSTPVGMVALENLTRSTWAGAVAPVAAGQSFWARYADSAGLIAGGLARAWTDSDAMLPASPEQPLTAHGIAGFAAGTSNASPHWAVPAPAGPPPRSQV